MNLIKLPENCTLIVSTENGLSWYSTEEVDLKDNREGLRGTPDYYVVNKEDPEDVVETNYYIIVDIPFNTFTTTVR